MTAPAKKPRTAHTELRDQRIWRGDSSLRGLRIVAIGFGANTSHYRARIVRDAYDYQCVALVEKWTTVGWQELQHMPITDLPIAAYTQAAHAYRKDSAGQSEWKSAMVASLEILTELAVQLLWSND